MIRYNEARCTRSRFIRSLGFHGGSLLPGDFISHSEISRELVRHCQGIFLSGVPPIVANTCFLARRESAFT